MPTVAPERLIRLQQQGDSIRNVGLYQRLVETLRKTDTGG